MWKAKNPIELMKTFRNKQWRIQTFRSEGWEGREGGGHSDPEISGGGGVGGDLKIKKTFFGFVWK